MVVLQALGAFIGFLAICEGKMLHQWVKFTFGLGLFALCAYGLLN